MQQSSGNTSNLGRSLYRRILRELKLTRNYDHHLRDIRFLLWVPGTQGKRKFDALKQLAEMSTSLHPRRAKRTAAVAPPVGEGAAAAAAAGSAAPPPPPVEPEPKNPNPTIADQIRAVARELFNHHAKMHEKFVMASSLPHPSSSSAAASSPPSSPITAEQVKQKAASAAKRVKLLQEGTARAFWAIKRLQDIRQGSVPTASMWLTGAQRAKFDPFTSLRETHLRGGAFPFLPEFLGVDENLVLASPEEEEDAVIAEAVEGLSTSSRCSGKNLRLEVVSRCASKDGPSARYHVSFRIENTARDAAMDIKLAHLFAVNCESAPVLTEMVCSLPLLGNSILRPSSDPSVPYSFSARDGDEDEEEEEEDDDANVDDDVNASADPQDDDVDGNDDEPEGKSSDLKQSSSNDNDSKAATTASLLPTASTSSSSSPLRDTFTAKSNTPDHCAVYDVTFPVQGDCVLRGVVFYRVITNATAPGATAGAGAAGSPPAPTTVKSRLKALHFPPIKLTAQEDADDDADD